MRRDLPDWAKRWLGMGGKVYYAHRNQPGDKPEVFGYIRAFNRAGARRIAQAHGAAVGSVLTQHGIVALQYTPELREVGAGEAYRGNPIDGMKRQMIPVVRRSEIVSHGGFTIAPMGDGRVVVSKNGRHIAIYGSQENAIAGIDDGTMGNRLDGGRVSKNPRKNPPLVIMGNPGRGRGRVLSRETISIRYIHATDGQPYEHKFGRDDVLECLPDGSFRVYNARGKRLWKDFK